jgi:RNA polymerase sigma-70 factor (ECF subfamily)
MVEDSSFLDFIRRIRAGDDRAAAELVRRYEPAIRREVRFRLRDARLLRLFDSMDVCQSVLASFFVRAAAGQYDLHEPAQLLKLLVTMTRNKVVSQARQQFRQRRDSRRLTGSRPEDLETTDDRASPSEEVAAQELLREFRRRLSAEERQLSDLRADGVAWAEVATRMGGTAEGRRLQLTRAIKRVVQELGLDEADDA